MLPSCKVLSLIFRKKKIFIVLSNLEFLLFIHFKEKVYGKFGRKAHQIVHLNYTFSNKNVGRFLH